MRQFCIIAVCLILAACVGPAVADDVYIGSAQDPIELDGLSASYEAQHEDGSPFKGWAFVTVKNTGGEAWGDFHFKIFAYPGGSTDISQVSFLDASMLDSLGNPGFNPISTQSGTTWSIDNNVIGAEMSLYFYGDPVAPGDVATFSVYTDNTASMANFGLMMWPSPVVPEPGSMLALATGLFGLVGFAIKKRR
jgi:hypothetical protein